MKTTDDVFQILRHDVSPEKAAELANAAGYHYFAVGGKAFEIIAFASDAVVFESRGTLDQLLEGLSSKVVDRSTTPEVPRMKTEPEGPSITVIDELYDDPMVAVREALAHDLRADPARHKGLRSRDFPISEPFRELFESVVGPVGGGHSAFQHNMAGDQLVFHSDQQRWAAAVYLTPVPPVSAGTSFWRSKHTRVRSSVDLDRLAGKDGWPSANELETLTYGGALLDRTRWEEVDRVGNVFNRLVIWDARLCHSVSDVFGHDLQTGRLCQLFFWNQA